MIDGVKRQGIINLEAKKVEIGSLLDDKDAGGVFTVGNHVLNHAKLAIIKNLCESDDEDRPVVDIARDINMDMNETRKHLNELEQVGITTYMNKGERNRWRINEFEIGIDVVFDGESLDMSAQVITEGVSREANTNRIRDSGGERS